MSLLIEHQLEFLADYHDQDVAARMQLAYQDCLEAESIQFFVKLYTCRKCSHRILPEKELLLQAMVLVISIYVQDLNAEAQNRQLSAETMKTFFDMLVFHDMVLEFLSFYKDLKRLSRLVPMVQPEASTLLTAIHLVEQKLAKTDSNFPKFQEIGQARQAIKEMFNM